MKKLYIVLAVFVLSALFGCNRPVAQTETYSEAERKMREYVSTLCSEEFAGRLSGTEGNARATEWLCETLYGLDVKTYKDNKYKNGFFYNYYDF